MTPTPHATPDPNQGGFPAYGTLVQVLSSTGAPDTYATILGVGDITGPGNSMAEVDVTSHSTGVPIKQTIPGLIDLGDLAFPCFWNPDDPTQSAQSSYGMEYLFFNRVVTKFQLVAPDPNHYTRQFKGFVYKMGEDYKVAGVMTRNIAIRITSAMTVVPSPITLTPSQNLTVPNAGTTVAATFQVASGGNMAPWTPVPSAPWIVITTPTAPQQGDGSVSYTVSAGTAGTSRSGTINISGLGLVFNITQLAT